MFSTLESYLGYSWKGEGGGFWATQHSPSRDKSGATTVFDRMSSGCKKLRQKTTRKRDTKVVTQPRDRSRDARREEGCWDLATGADQQPWGHLAPAASKWCQHPVVSQLHTVKHNWRTSFATWPLMQGHVIHLRMFSTLEQSCTSPGKGGGGGFRPPSTVPPETSLERQRCLTALWISREGPGGDYGRTPNKWLLPKK